MSISDRIVVMRQGVIQQMDEPQKIYDDPDNLFVAKFLGTPPVNVFDGTVREGKLLLDGQAVLEVPGAPEGDVTVGIRPEGFIPKADGKLSCQLQAVEVMGRDISVVAAHPACQTQTLRAIVSAENLSALNGAKAVFDLKPDKVLLFDPKTQARIRFAAE